MLTDAAGLNNRNPLTPPGTQQTAMRRMGGPRPMMDPNNSGAMQRARDRRSGFMASQMGVHQVVPLPQTEGSRIAAQAPLGAMLDPETLAELNRLYGYSVWTLR